MIRSNNLVARRAIVLFGVVLVASLLARSVVVTAEGALHAMAISHQANDSAGAVRHCVVSESHCGPTDDSGPHAPHVHSATDVSVKVSTIADGLGAPIEFCLGQLGIEDQIVRPGRGQVAPDRPPKT